MRPIEEPDGISVQVVVGSNGSQPVEEASPSEHGVKWASVVPVVVTLLAIVGIIVAGTLDVYARHPMSTLDEHAHFDYAVAISHGELPYAGRVYSREVIEEWACGVGHQAGRIPADCTNDIMPAPSDLPSGQYSTAYIHYPIYYALAVGFSKVVQPILGINSFITALRLFSLAVFVLGVVACWVFARMLGLQKWALTAATLIPAANPVAFALSTYVNPGSTQILTGALVAGTALLWIKRGKGFIWVVLAGLFASCTAAVNSLAVGVIILVSLWAWWKRIRHRPDSHLWQPRWWHIGVLALVVLAPIAIWNRVIAATRTVSNQVLYAYYSGDSISDLVKGLFVEASRAHTPWLDAWAGLPSFGTWITGIVLVIILLRALGFRISPSESSADLTPLETNMRALTVSTLLVFILFPIALRLTNYWTFGINTEIVFRYSIAMAPLMVLLALISVRHSRVDILLTVVGTLGVAFMCWGSTHILL